MEHEAGNYNCGACRRAYPVRCVCGGLIHADKGPELAWECDRCDEPRAAAADDGVVKFLIRRSAGGRDEFRTEDGWTADRGAARRFTHLEAPVELDRLEREEGAEGCHITSE